MSKLEDIITANRQADEARLAGQPHGWIQWKGTNVCIDLTCTTCGEEAHYDGDFFYYWKCGSCGQRWQMGAHVAMYPLPAEGEVEVEVTTKASR